MINNKQTRLPKRGQGISHKIQNRIEGCWIFFPIAWQNYSDIKIKLLWVLNLLRHSNAVLCIHLFVLFFCFFLSASISSVTHLFLMSQRALTFSNQSIHIYKCFAGSCEQKGKICFFLGHEKAEKSLFFGGENFKVNIWMQLILTS